MCRSCESFNFPNLVVTSSHGQGRYILIICWEKSWQQKTPRNMCNVAAILVTADLRSPLGLVSFHGAHLYLRYLSSHSPIHNHLRLLLSHDSPPLCAERRNCLRSIQHARRAVDISLDTLTSQSRRDRRHTEKYCGSTWHISSNGHAFVGVTKRGRGVAPVILPETHSGKLAKFSRAQG